MSDICYFVTEQDDGETWVKGFSNAVSSGEFFWNVTRAICFSDCSNDRVSEIVWHGVHLWYGGWLPGMHYQYFDEDDHLIWEDWFPEWDH